MLQKIYHFLEFQALNKSDEESVKRKREQTEFIDQQRQSSKKSKLSEDLENNVPLAHVPKEMTEQVVEPLPKITRCDVRIKKEDLSTYYCDILGSDKPQDNCNAAELSEKELAAIHKPERDMKKINSAASHEESNSKDAIRYPNLKAGSCIKESIEEVESKDIVNNDGEIIVEVVKDATERVMQSEDEWYFGTLYSCKLCNFATKIKSKFEDHVQSAHNSTLAKFHKKYTKTSEKYTCKVCSHVTRHDVEEISRHVDSHFLSLEMYGSLYERNIQQIREKRKQEEANKRMDKTLNNKSKSDDPTEKSDALCENKESKKDNVEKETIDKETLEIQTMSSHKDEDVITTDDNLISKALKKCKEVRVLIKKEVILFPLPIESNEDVKSSLSTNDYVNSVSVYDKVPESVISVEEEAKSLYDLPLVDVSEEVEDCHGMSQVIEDVLNDLEDPDSSLSKVIDRFETEDLDQLDEIQRDQKRESNVAEIEVEGLDTLKKIQGDSSSVRIVTEDLDEDGPIHKQGAAPSVPKSENHDDEILGGGRTNHSSVSELKPRDSSEPSSSSTSSSRIISSPRSKPIEASKSSLQSSKEDNEVYIYCCPLHNCSFTTDLQVGVKCSLSFPEMIISDK